MNSQNQPRPEWDRILSASQRNNATEIENLILHHGVSPSHSNAVGQSALHVASLWGNIDAVRTLLKHGADTNAQNRINGATPLHSIVQSMKKPIGNRIKCIQLILDEKYGCNPNIKDYYGLTALECLHEIISKRDNGGGGNSFDDEGDWKEYDEMEKILSTQMDILLRQSRHVIFTLIEECNAEQIKLYLEEENDEQHPQEYINKCDLKTGLTPLQCAIDKLLHLCNHDHDNEKEEEGNNNNHYFKTIQSIKEIIKLLLNHNADIDINSKSSKEGTTNNQELASSSLMMIPDNNDMKINVDDPIHDLCKLLSSHYYNNSNNNEKNRMIESLLEEITLMIISHGSGDRSTSTSNKSIRLSNSTTQILHDAARKGSIQTVKFWIEKLQVDVNIKGRQGLTPLHFAARSGKVDIVNYLIGLGTVDTTLLDDRGKTALDAAMVNEKDEVIEVLQKFG